MKKRECVSCGAPIEVGATKCQYCGMTCEPEYWDGLIRYVPYHVNMRRVEAAVRIPDDFVIQGDPDALTNYAIRDITRKIAERLAEIAQYRIIKDPMSCSTVVRGSVLVAADRRTDYA